MLTVFNVDQAMGLAFVRSIRIACATPISLCAEEEDGNDV